MQMGKSMQEKCFIVTDESGSLEERKRFTDEIEGFLGFKRGLKEGYDNAPDKSKTREKLVRNLEDEILILNAIVASERFNERGREIAEENNDE